MNIIRILAKEFKQNIRNWKANSMMVLFPIILILILGAAFKGVFDNSVNLSNTQALYTVQGRAELSEGFKGFISDIGDKTGIQFTETADTEEGIRSIKDVTYACYIWISESDGKARLYKNERYNFEAGLLESLLSTFVQKYNVIAEIFSVSPEAAVKIAAGHPQGTYVELSSLDKKKQPGSMDYYAVSMLTLILMYASLTGLWSIKSEQNLKTGSRILCSPIRKYEVLTGKVLGCIAVTIVQALVVIGFSKLILKADWGNDLPTILLVVLSQAMMTIGMGVGLAYLIKNDGAASGLLNTLIPFVVFLGGGYMPIDQFGEALRKLADISPVRWVNKAIFSVIYNQDYSAVPTAIFLNLAVAALFIAAAAVFSKKEAA